MKPNETYSLDRIDNNGDYTPDNCRWASAVTQGNNRRTNRKITFNGQTKNITQWVKHFGVNQSTIDGLITKYGNEQTYLILSKYS